MCRPRVHDLELIVVHLGNHLRLPLFREQLEFPLKIDHAMVHLELLSARAFCAQGL
jgi:hypothetical protein